MPIYEFKCIKAECGHVFEEYIKPDERLRKINSGEIWPLCEKCCGRTKKIMSISNYKMNGYNESNGYSNAGRQK